MFGHSFLLVHAHLHHAVIIAIIVIIAMLTLCCSIMSRGTLVHYYHACMLNLANLLSIVCTLVATCTILWRLECTRYYYTPLEHEGGHGLSITYLQYLLKLERLQLQHQVG